MTDVSSTALSAQLAKALSQRIDERFEEVKSAYLESVAILSTKSHPAPGAPYGEAIGRVLAHAQAAAEGLGLAAENIDDRCVAADAGDGVEYVAAIGHLDVVPTGPGWTREPIGPTIEGDIVYGRGVTDDKSGSFASLLAVAAINDLIRAGRLELPRRVRVIFGGDEESGMSCIQHYMATQPAPTYAVAPDGDWPAVFAEKGMATITIEGPAPAPDELYVESIAAGTRSNVVPPMAEATLTGAHAALDAAAEVLGGYWDRNVTWERLGEKLALHAAGRGEHASRPFAGDSAIARLLRTIVDLPVGAGAFWETVLAWTNASGEGLALACWDEVTGPTSVNLGLATLSAGRLALELDVRHPICRDEAWVRQQVSAAVAPLGLGVVDLWTIPPMHEPIDGPLVATVQAVYDAASDGGKKAFSRGARTYAAYVPHCVCVGRNLPGEPRGGIHGPDEHYSLKSLRGAGKMLAELLIRLARTAAT